MVDEGGMGTQVYGKGEWPVDPQKDRPILPERIWIDGCFDFFHHGMPHDNPALSAPSR